MTKEKSRDELAQSRTDLAEDRTLLANERTFAGWVRTGLAAIGVGIAFHALFPSLQPVWVAKALATLFVAIAVFIFWAADRRAHDVHIKMKAHEVETAGATSLRLITITLTAAVAGLIAAIWLLI